MHSVCCCSLLVWRRSFLKKGTPRGLFLPRPGSAPGRIWPKNNNTCKGPWVLHPYQVSSKSINSGEEVENVNSLTDDGRRTTDGRTDAGQRVITIGHWSLWLLCPKNRKNEKERKEIIEKSNEKSAKKNRNAKNESKTVRKEKKQNKKKRKEKTRIEPVGEPYREVCLSPWKGNWRISKNRIDWRNVLLSEEK